MMVQPARMWFILIFCCILVIQDCFGYDWTGCKSKVYIRLEVDSSEEYSFVFQVIFGLLSKVANCSWSKKMRVLC